MDGCLLFCAHLYVSSVLYKICAKLTQGFGMPPFASLYIVPNRQSRAITHCVRLHRTMYTLYACLILIHGFNRSKSKIQKPSKHSFCHWNFKQKISHKHTHFAHSDVSNQSMGQRAEAAAAARTIAARGTGCSQPDLNTYPTSEPVYCQQASIVIDKS